MVVFSSAIAEAAALNMVGEAEGDIVVPYRDIVRSKQFCNFNSWWDKGSQGSVRSWVASVSARPVGKN